MCERYPERLITGGCAQWITRRSIDVIEWIPRDSSFLWMMEKDVVLNADTMCCSRCKRNLVTVRLGEKWAFIRKTSGVTEEFTQNTGNTDLCLCPLCFDTLKFPLQEKILRKRDLNTPIPTTNEEMIRNITNHRHFKQLPEQLINMFDSFKEIMMKATNSDLITKVWLHLYRGNCLQL